MVSTPLVYIGGAGRSGSTLLERMLACVPGYWPVGELEFIWQRGLQRNDLCGCGARFADCPFWTQVGAVGFGGWDQVDVDAAVRLRARLDRHRNIDRLAGIRSNAKLAPDLAAFTELSSRLYRAVRDVSGAPVLVDSSKNVSYALLLRNLDDFDLRLIHLVRRSHGVAYSWAKRVRKPGVGDGSEFMSTHPPSWAIGLWIADNLLYESLLRRLPRATRVRYEDLITDPRREIVRLISDLDLPAEDLTLGFLRGSVAELPSSHAISGNPMRATQGQVVLRADDEWRTAMSKGRQVTISAATWPLLLRYGYQIAPRAQHRP